MNSGRDQVQILKDMITDEFTVKTGIPVNLSLVQTGFVEATLAGPARMFSSASRADSRSTSPAAARLPT